MACSEQCFNTVGFKLSRHLLAHEAKYVYPKKWLDATGDHKGKTIITLEG
jgi:hypothetical protein